MFAVTSMSGSSASAGILSGPAALPFLICLMISPVSSIVGGVTCVEKSVCVALMFGGFNEVDILERFSVFYPSVPLFFSLSDCFFVVSYSCLIFPSLAAFSCRC
ncbi:unnamed protein product [Schistosoma haematobium]|nr:unnamed protein product [Schistosoma haematobium]